LHGRYNAPKQQRAPKKIQPQIKSLHPAYRADIDGLRAVAVVAVVAFHAFPGALPGGFIGVDIFFVISGFLISTIVFSNLEHSRFSVRDFYIRRIRRIFPALIVVLCAGLAFGWYALLQDEFARLGKHVAGGAAFILNFVFLKESGYFDTAAAAKPMLHLWSLSIEEQFYLFWPLLVAYVWRRQFSFLKLTALVALASFAVNIYLANHKPIAAFYSPQSRFWELMIGGILAYITLHAPELNRGLQNTRSLLGCALLAAGFAYINTGRAFPGWWALMPTLSGFLIISAGPTSWFNRIVLSNRVLVWVGLISYPLYLWHWPLLSFARIVSGAAPSLAWRTAAVALAVILAWLTYRFIETPFRAGNGGRKAAFAGALMCVICAVAVLAYVEVLQPRNKYPVIQTLSRIGDFEYLTNLNDVNEKHSGEYIIKSDNSTTTLFFGDSHMAQYAPRVGQLIGAKPADFNTAIFVVFGGCPPIPNVYEADKMHEKCPEMYEKALKSVHDDKVKAVVIGAAWGVYLFDQTRSPKVNPADYDYYFLQNGKREYFRDGRGAPLALSALESFLTSVAKQKKTYLLLDNLVGDGYDPHNYFDRHVLPAADRPSQGPVSADINQLQIRGQLIEIARSAGVEIIDPLAKLCHDNMCERLTADGEPVFKDNNHLSPLWIEKNADYIDKTIKFLGAAH
jgi:peptidoglycan/LPS O-acetylase OafA/YrhL